MTTPILQHMQEYTCDHGEPWGDCPKDCQLPPDPLAAVRDGAWLDEQHFPDLAYAVPELIPEGLTLLVGPPKIGKSWLILGMLLAVAAGGVALGTIRLHRPRRVLYLALEDGDRRMQDRCRQLLHGDPIPGLYTYLTRADPMTILPTIEAYLQRYQETALVVVDTLGKVMPQALPQETMYQRDYRIGGRLKAVADSRPGLALVVVHHDRKAGAEDFVERVSGSHGLAGSADTVVVLSRDRQSAEGGIQVTGRDIAEGEYALTMASFGAWALDGHNLADAAQRLKERRATDGLGDRAAEVVQLVNDHPDGITPARVAAELGMDAKTAQVYLGRALAAGRIAKPRRGLYNPVGSVGLLVSPPPEPTQPTHPTPPMEGDPVVGRVARCGCGNALYHPGSIEAGVCERCRLATHEASAGDSSGEKEE
jgi:hypothetical protein